MKMNVDSKALAEAINKIVRVTSADDINFLCTKHKTLELRSSNKGYAYHINTGIELTNCDVGDEYTIPLHFVTAINRRGNITVLVKDGEIKAKNASKFSVAINIPPTTESEEVASSKDTLDLTQDTISELTNHLPSLDLQNIYGTSTPIVRIDCKKGKLRLVALDPSHLSYFKLSVPSQSDFSIDLSHGDLSSLLEVIEEHPNAEFAVEASRVYVKSESVVLSYPKCQAGSLTAFESIETLKKRVLGNTEYETLRGVDVAILSQEVASCLSIASAKDPITFACTSNTEYEISYKSDRGRIKTTANCDSAWSPNRSFSVDPVLVADFLDLLLLLETVDINLLSDLNQIFVHSKTDGYETFHICSGNSAT